MSPRDMARAIGLGRIGIGVTLLALPGTAARMWIGRDGAQPAAKVLVRAVGVRDLGLGLGVVRALDREDAPARGWVEAGMVADLVDLGATLVGRDVPALSRLGILVLAGSAAAAGAWLAPSVDEGDSSDQ